MINRTFSPGDFLVFCTVVPVAAKQLGVGGGRAHLPSRTSLMSTHPISCSLACCCGLIVSFNSADALLQAFEGCSLNACLFLWRMHTEDYYVLE